MSETITVWVGATIIYLYGTVNDEAATFTLVGDGAWQAVVARSEDNNYTIHLEAYSSSGLDGTYDYTLYYGWLPVVTDRAQSDVTRLKYLRNKGWDNMSAAERAEWLGTLKGAYNYTDLNRVGQNVRFLVDELAGYGYTVSVMPKVDWALGDIPTAAQMQQYLVDVAALKTTFYGTTELPATMTGLTAEAANNIEKLLLEISTYITRMAEGFLKCGTQKCGSEVIL